MADGVSIVDQVSVQALAIVVTIVWSAFFSYVILKVIDIFIGLRVSDEQEVEGLDIALHDETGYHNL